MGFLVLISVLLGTLNNEYKPWISEHIQLKQLRNTPALGVTLYVPIIVILLCDHASHYGRCVPLINTAACDHIFYYTIWRIVAGETLLCDAILWSVSCTELSKSLSDARNFWNFHWCTWRAIIFLCVLIIICLGCGLSWLRSLEPEIKWNGRHRDIYSSPYSTAVWVEIILFLRKAGASTSRLMPECWFVSLHRKFVLFENHICGIICWILGFCMYGCPPEGGRWSLDKCVEVRAMSGAKTLIICKDFI